MHIKTHPRPPVLELSSWLQVISLEQLCRSRHHADKEKSILSSSSAIYHLLTCDSLLPVHSMFLPYLNVAICRTDAISSAPVSCLMGESHYEPPQGSLVLEAQSGYIYTNVQRSLCCLANTASNLHNLSDG